MKTEKQKMLDGELYHASDPVLCHDRLKARKMTNELSLTIRTKSTTIKGPS